MATKPPSGCSSKKICQQDAQGMNVLKKIFLSNQAPSNELSKNSPSDFCSRNLEGGVTSSLNLRACGTPGKAASTADTTQLMISSVCLEANSALKVLKVKVTCEDKSKRTSGTKVK